MNGEWTFKNTHDGRKADYTGALRDVHLTLQSAGESLSKLEHIESELDRNKVIAIFEAAKIKMDLIISNIY